MYECCEECAENKYKMRAVMNLQEAESLDANNNNLENTNEENETISNEKICL